MEKSLFSSRRIEERKGSKKEGRDLGERGAVGSNHLVVHAPLHPERVRY